MTLDAMEREFYSHYDPFYNSYWSVGYRFNSIRNNAILDDSWVINFRNNDKDWNREYEDEDKFMGYAA